MSAVNSTTSSEFLSQYGIKQDDKAKGSDELGQGEFMELMLAQLKNQNPLEPQDNGEFIAQLAQFSSLEEMQKVSSAVDNVVGEFRSTQALQASAMVGRTVLVPGTAAKLVSEGEIEGAVAVQASTSNLKISIKNSAGELVRQIDLGQAAKGYEKFTWDGNDANGDPLPPGKYEFVAEGSYPSGTEQLGTLISANVDSVSLGGAGEITLNLAGQGSVALADVYQIN
ncbi:MULTISPECIES: flagellar hook assembly protein FlgD [Marinobacter]|uniref:flagellar hook assembly protein FlgD n=1 Tax=Marinobacter TaxID=2742 RepID=UPI001D084E33|nr:MULTISPECIES: flagellar hook assembly protein FlgD [Marinobacter]MCG8519718.1 flagellar hook assembly protein FlgD [Pseudomonadales bacterium]MCK7565801.1 flagellar hook assembly protein FlgD [Marinobacter xestospongiae]UDL03526.1 flagellar hook assembly protein FlgD [Marinobacter sp. CA1]